MQITMKALGSFQKDAALSDSDTPANPNDVDRIDMPLVQVLLNLNAERASGSVRFGVRTDFRTELSQHYPRPAVPRTRLTAGRLTQPRGKWQQYRRRYGERGTEYYRTFIFAPPPASVFAGSLSPLMSAAELTGQSSLVRHRRICGCVCAYGVRVRIKAWRTGAVVDAVLAALTVRRTVHVFAVNRYGGRANVTSHIMEKRWWAVRSRCIGVGPVGWGAEFAEGDGGVEASHASMEVSLPAAAIGGLNFLNLCRLPDVDTDVDTEELAVEWISCNFG
ncbi:hypothetical protein R3P38DRAFT_2805942 [Favolaschia claudopus]|uniref:Uncharacterized protein n=1 Tax=Favolaschia claudopus TaxID=2862362 RepID=A0AAV9ZLX2_9AGAR